MWLQRSKVRTSRGRRTGSGQSRRMKSGRRSLRGRCGRQTLSSMVCFHHHLHWFHRPFCPWPLLDDSHAAQWKYKKDVNKLKPDLEAYNKQKEVAMGLVPGTLSQNGSFAFALMSFDPTRASSSQVTLLIPSLLLINTEFGFQDGSNHSPAAGGSGRPLP